MATKKGLSTKQKKPAIFKLKNIAIVCLLTYAVIVLVSQQVTIAEKKKENQKVNSEVIAAQQTNDELSSLLSMSDEKEFMEKIAIEKLGYGYDNETRIYDASKN